MNPALHTKQTPILSARRMNFFLCEELLPPPGHNPRYFSYTSTPLSSSEEERELITSITPLSSSPSLSSSAAASMNLLKITDASMSFKPAPPSGPKYLTLPSGTDLREQFVILYSPSLPDCFTPSTFVMIPTPSHVEVKKAKAKAAKPWKSATMRYLNRAVLRITEYR